MQDPNRTVWQTYGTGRNASCEMQAAEVCSVVDMPAKELVAIAFSSDRGVALGRKLLSCRQTAALSTRFDTLTTAQ